MFFNKQWQMIKNFTSRIDHTPLYIDQINCVTLHLVGYTLEDISDARAIEHQIHYVRDASPIVFT